MQTHVARRRRIGGQTDPAVSHLAVYVTVGKYKAEGRRAAVPMAE